MLGGCCISNLVRLSTHCQLTVLEGDSVRHRSCDPFYRFPPSERLCWSPFWVGFRFKRALWRLSTHCLGSNSWQRHRPCGPFLPVIRRLGFRSPRDAAFVGRSVDMTADWRWSGAPLSRPSGCQRFLPPHLPGPSRPVVLDGPCWGGTGHHLSALSTHCQLTAYIFLTFALVRGRIFVLWGRALGRVREGTE